LGEKDAHDGQGNTAAHCDALQANVQFAENHKNEDPQRTRDRFHAFVEIEHGPVALKKVTDNPKIDERIFIHPAPLEAKNRNDDGWSKRQRGEHNHPERGRHSSSTRADRRRRHRIWGIVSAPRIPVLGRAASHATRRNRPHSQTTRHVAIIHQRRILARRGIDPPSFALCILHDARPRPTHP
jgi:hypothetical protein